jgi:hypothetical protein
MLLAALIAHSAHAWELDFSTRSNIGCDPQWSSACLSNNVWGEEDSLAGATCGSTDSLYMRGASIPAAIGFDKESLNGSSQVLAFVNGDAATSAVKVKIQVQYFNASNALVGSATKTLHTGSAGHFAASTTFTGIPGSATQFASRLIVESGTAVILSAAAEDDEDVEGDCEITCYDNDGGTYTVKGWMEGGLCTAECPSDGECDPTTWPALTDMW